MTTPHKDALPSNTNTNTNAVATAPLPADEGDEQAAPLTHSTAKAVVKRHPAAAANVPKLPDTRSPSGPLFAREGNKKSTRAVEGPPPVGETTHEDRAASTDAAPARAKSSHAMLQDQHALLLELQQSLHTLTGRFTRVEKYTHELYDVLLADDDLPEPAASRDVAAYDDELDELDLDDELADELEPGEDVYASAKPLRKGAPVAPANAAATAPMRRAKSIGAAAAPAVRPIIGKKRKLEDAAGGAPPKKARVLGPRTSALSRAAPSGGSYERGGYAGGGGGYGSYGAARGGYERGGMGAQRSYDFD